MVYWKGLCLGRGRLADLAGGDLHVLLLERGDDVARGEILRRHHWGRAASHAVILLAEEGDVAHAFQPGEVVLDIDAGIVAQVELVELPGRARRGSPRA